MSKRKNLIDKLTVAVDALTNNTIHYDWKEQSSCNAGLVAQAMLGLIRSELNKERQSIFKVLEDVNKDRREAEQTTYRLTWKNAIKWSCPITGESGYRIIDRLEKAGLSRKDIVHLEYLENPAILKESGIEKGKMVEMIKIGEDVRIEEVQDTSFFGRLFNRTIQKRIVTPQWEERVTYSYPENYYADKTNLIKYLSAWIRLLQSEGDAEATDRVGLEAELLRAVADENFERAAELRNQLAVKVIFLDHDGVICLSQQWGGRFKKKGFNRSLSTPLDLRMDDFDPKAIKLLNRILDETGAEIVVSSDWRNWSTLEQMQEMYVTRGIKPPIEVTPFLENCEVPSGFIWSHEADLEQTRSLEILQWLKDHPEVTHWVAVDDLDMSIHKTENFTWGLENFVLTPRSREGIKQCGVADKIIKFLS